MPWPPLNTDEFIWKRLEDVYAFRASWCSTQVSTDWAGDVTLTLWSRLKFKTLGAFKTEQDFDRWFNTSMRLEFWHHFLKEQKRHQKVRDAVASRGDICVEQERRYSTAAAAISELVSEIPDRRQREAFLLYALESYTIREIAAYLNVPVATAHALIVDARAWLRSRLDT